MKISDHELIIGRTLYRNNMEGIAKSMNPERYTWNEKDFNDLGWHDNRIRALFFEHQDYAISMSIDYIYKWEENFKGYWVAPAVFFFITFHP